MNVVDPFLEPKGLAQECLQRTTPYRDGFIACFHRYGAPAPLRLHAVGTSSGATGGPVMRCCNLCGKASTQPDRGS